MKIRIKEGSSFARMAARIMKCDTVAIVFGRSIHLWNISRKDFLRSATWVAHELEHVRQYQHYGFVSFCLLYLWESARKGYHNNRFEIEARKAEVILPDLKGIEFV